MQIAPKEYCNGCSILSLDKQFHCKLPIPKRDCDVLFIIDSYKPDGLLLDDSTVDLLSRAISKIKTKIKWDVVASVQCPSVKDEDMTPTDRNQCRNYISSIISSANPRLIITLGNLAFKMVTRKSGIMDKRGSRFDISQETESYIVVPTFHPFSVVAEPKYRYFFELDIRNAVEKYILHKTEHQAFTHKLILNVNELDQYEFLAEVKEPIAIDIETTGLNFKKNYITTIGFSWSTGTIVIPWKHKEGKFEKEEDFEKAKAFVKRLLENKNNKKILQNAKFDMKFLKVEGIEVINPWDTMVMAHLIYEDRRKGLLDLVKEKFPRELENL